MWISKKKFERIQDYIEVLQKDVMRTRKWHACKNCHVIFNHDSCISTRMAFDYCEPCRPKMKKKLELKTWAENNEEQIKRLKDEIEMQKPPTNKEL